jgi:malonate-semialdehyde dehydrogenase (acetylating) / methylmalonate-semialdehyde dehydrogenase
MPDADIDNAVSALMGAAYGSCGERCMAISWSWCVGDQVADTLVAKLAPKIKALKMVPAPSAASTWARWLPVRRVTRSKAMSTPAWPRAHAWWSMARPGGAGHEDGYFLGGTLFDT